MPLMSERMGKGLVAKPAREDDGGLPAMTEYSSILYSPLAGGFTLLSMNPYSGRYHQTRAHCAFGLRAPVVGDPVYYQLSNEVSTVSDFKVRRLCCLSTFYVGLRHERTEAPPEVRRGLILRRDRGVPLTAAHRAAGGAAVRQMQLIVTCTAPLKRQGSDTLLKWSII